MLSSASRSSFHLDLGNAVFVSIDGVFHLLAQQGIPGIRVILASADIPPAPGGGKMAHIQVFAVRQSFLQLCLFLVGNQRGIHNAQTLQFRQGEHGGNVIQARHIGKIQMLDIGAGEQGRDVGNIRGKQFQIFQLIVICQRGNIRNFRNGNDTNFQVGHMGQKFTLGQLPDMANVNVLLGITPKSNLLDVITKRKKMTDIIQNTEVGIQFIAGANGFSRIANLTDDERNSFAEELRMIDVSGWNVEDARSALERMNLIVETIYVESTTYGENIVINSSIVKDELIAEGSTVTLTVSAGMAAVLVPNIEGDTYEAAYAELTNAGFKIKRAESYSGGVAKGRVISQNPGAGETIPKGSTTTTERARLRSR